MLKQPTRSTTRQHSWCGPTALAVLTGLTYDEVYPRMVDAINRHSRKLARERQLPADYWVKKAFRGVSTSDLIIAAKHFNVTVKWARKPGPGRYQPYLHRGVTLLTFVREHTVKGKTYLVVAANHYVVVKDGIVYDNTSKGPFHVEQYPRAKLGRLRCFAEVRPRPEALVA